MSFEPAAGDDLIRKGLANLERMPEVVGGQLMLTRHWLAFEPHGTNVQTAPEHIAVADIAHVEVSKSRILGIGILPNGLVVRTKAGREFRFVVHKREEWRAAILGAIGPP